MTQKVRKLTDELAWAVAQQHNAIIKDLAIAGSKVHYNQTKRVTTGTPPYGMTLDTVDAANGDGTPAKTVALANALLVTANRHFADTLSHKAATTPIGTAAATDLATAITLLNAVKAAYVAHIAATTYHIAADATNTVTAADASSQATADTLANELKGDFNAHIALAPLADMLSIVKP